MARDASTWNGQDAWHRTGSTVSGLCRAWESEATAGAISHTRRADERQPGPRPMAWADMTTAERHRQALDDGPRQPWWDDATATQREAYRRRVGQLYPTG